MRMVLALVLAMAMAVSADATEISKSGECKLQVSKSPFDPTKVFLMTVGNDKINVTCRFYGQDFFGRFALFATPFITNKSGNPINAACNVAFFDKSGELIASALQTDDLKADAKDWQFGGCLSRIPKESFDRITSYKLIIYLSDAKKDQ